MCVQVTIMNLSSMFHDFEFESEYGCICSPGYIQHIKGNNIVALEGAS